MNKEGLFISIINNIDLNNEYYQELTKYLQFLNNNYPAYIDIVNNINTSKIYNSKIHGIYHSEKVFLFSLLIALNDKLPVDEMQIIIDAAIYHDMGRNNDYEDSFHGLASAIRVKEIANHPVYQNKENLELLKAIIDMHSREDYQEDKAFADYELSDKAKFKRLYSILKDADALDRKRFYDSNRETFDESYLRNSYSKNLIKLATDLNYLYKQNVNRLNSSRLLKEYENETLESATLGCYHGIGADLFKLNSILKHGVLSKSAMNSVGIPVICNFEGYNHEHWISVVDEAKKAKGHAEFINQSMSFYLKVNKLHEGLPRSQRYHAIDLGLPVNTGEYEDEKFAYKRIPTENIKQLLIPQNIANKPLNKLNYMNNSLNINIIDKKVENYYQNIIKETGFVPNIDEVKKIILAYRNKVSEFELKPLYEQKINQTEFFNSLHDLEAKINSEVANWIGNAFDQKFGFKNVTLIMAVNYILKKNNIDYLIFNEQEQITVAFSIPSMEKVKTPVMVRNSF